jgi:hypothetical protein
MFLFIYSYSLEKCGLHRNGIQRWTFINTVVLLEILQTRSPLYMAISSPCVCGVFSPIRLAAQMSKLLSMQSRLGKLNDVLLPSGECSYLKPILIIGLLRVS